VRIDKWMSRPPASVKPLDTIQHAREIMENRRINQLPVVVRQQIVGLITDRDLRDAFPSVFADRKSTTNLPDPGKITVEEVMTPNVVTIDAAETIEKAVRMMIRERFGSVPVVDGDHLVGILTRSDILRAFVTLCESMKPTALPEPSEHPESKQSKERARKRASTR